MAALIRRSILSILLACGSGAAIAQTPDTVAAESEELKPDTPPLAPAGDAAKDSPPERLDIEGATAILNLSPYVPPPQPFEIAPTSGAPDSFNFPDQPNSMLDRAHRGLHSVLWRSAMNIDRWFGADMPESTYQSRAVGSITPAVLYDERDGVSQRVRFRVKIPLPHLGQRYQAFIGTFNRDEFVTEREQASGAIPRSRQRNMQDDQETLLGIGYRNPDKSSNFDADAGIRIRSPLDPFVKGSFRYSLGSVDALRLGLRETVFWQNSEGLGVTSRVDVERLFRNNTLLNWAVSATFSEESEGVRGYTSITSYRPLSTRRAIGAQLFASSELDAEVPLDDYGVRFSFRQSVWRDWLVMEIRPSATFPKEFREEKRQLNLGIGIGFEIFFGVTDFQARPAMF